MYSMDLSFAYSELLSFHAIGCCGINTENPREFVNQLNSGAVQTE